MLPTTKRLITIGGFACLVALSPSATARANGSDAVVCGFQANVVHEASDGTGAFHTTNGVLDCAGTVEDRTVLGSGSFDLQGDPDTNGPGPSTCGVGSGSGTVSIRLPYFLAIMDPDPYATLEGGFRYLAAGSTWEADGAVEGSSTRTNLLVLGHSRGCGSQSPAELSGTILLAGTARSSVAPKDARCANTVTGTYRADRLKGTRGEDLISGFAGTDTLTAKSGADCLFGGPGRDRLRGGPGADAIRCGTGHDIVIADPADDVARSCETVRGR